MKVENIFKWSIVIISEFNNIKFNYIFNKIRNDIINNDLQDEIELLYYINNDNLDNYQKLNHLINLCKGKYISFINEEDDISDNFIKDIYLNLNHDCLFLNIINYKNGNFYKKDLNIDFIFPIKKNLIDDDYLSGGFNGNYHYLEDVYVFKKLKNKEYFSIIITAYDSVDFIEDCLDSIENQTYFLNNNNYEILVGVDGCENTLNKLNDIKYKYRNLFIYMMFDNKGTYVTTNTLLNLVKYDNVIRFDSDDIMVDTMINDIVDFKCNKSADIIKLGSVSLKDGIIGNIVSVLDGVIYFKRGIMDDVAGGYEPWLCAADTELLNRLNGKVKIEILNKKVFIRRIHDNNLTINYNTSYRSSIRKKYVDIMMLKSYNDYNVKISRIVNNIRIDINNKVLVIIPAFNSEKTIIESIDSVINQTYKNIKIVVVDDCSNDDTYNILNNINYNNLKVYKLEKNIGTYNAINYALYKENDYKFFIIHGSDDIMLSDKIDKHVKCLNDKYKATISNYLRVDFNNKKITNNIFKGHSMILYSKDVFDKIGYYDNTRYGGDTEYMERFTLCFGEDKMFYINEFLTKAYINDNNLTKLIPIGGKDRVDYVKLYKNEHVKMVKSKNYFKFNNFNIDYSILNEELCDNEDKVIMSVALPIFNSDKIIWLALDSLCKQKNVKFKWELIVCEEFDNNQVGFDYFKQYFEKLKDVGCYSFKYIQLTNRISLAKKWQIIGDNLNKDSMCFILKAADCYSPSFRLYDSYQYIIEDNYDWLDFKKGYFYSFISKRMFLYDYDGKTNLNMAFKSEYAKNIPDTNLTKGIDGFLYDHCMNNNNEFKCYHNDILYMDSLDTHGFNNISLLRENYFDSKSNIFKKLDYTVDNLNIEIDIINKIKNLK